MTYSVGQVATLANVTVRTLHHDEVSTILDDPAADAAGSCGASPRTRRPRKLGSIREGTPDRPPGPIAFGEATIDRR
jgi:hypothetical protein